MAPKTARGFFLAPRGMGSLSTPMGQDQIDGLVGALGEIADRLPRWPQ